MSIGCADPVKFGDSESPSILSGCGAVVSGVVPAGASGWGGSEQAGASVQNGIHLCTRIQGCVTACKSGMGGAVQELNRDGQRTPVVDSNDIEVVGFDSVTMVDLASVAGGDRFEQQNFAKLIGHRSVLSLARDNNKLPCPQVN